MADTRKTFSFGFLMGCSSLLLIAGAVGAAYGMRTFFPAASRPPIAAPDQGAKEPVKGSDPEKGKEQAPENSPEKGQQPDPAKGTGPDPAQAAELAIRVVGDDFHPLGTLGWEGSIAFTIAGIKGKARGKATAYDILLEAEAVRPSGEVSPDVKMKGPLQHESEAPLDSLPATLTFKVPAEQGAGEWTFRIRVTDNVGQAKGSAEHRVRLAPPPAGAVGLTLVEVKAEAPQGGVYPFKIAAVVHGFGLANKSGQEAPDLTFDVETRGPDGAVVPALTKKGFLEARDASAVVKEQMPVSFDLRTPAGSFVARISVIDRLNGTTASIDVPLEAVAGGVPASGDDLALQHFRRGQELAAKGEKEKAIEEYTAALQAQPQMTAALLNRGDLLEETHQTDAAIADYEAVLKIEPANAVAMNDLAYVWHNKGEAEKALRYANWAVESDRALLEAYLMRGRIHDAAGRLKEALADFKKFLELAPDSPSALQVKAKIKELETRKK